MCACMYRYIRMCVQPYSPTYYIRLYVCVLPQDRQKSNTPSLLMW